MSRRRAQQFGPSPMEALVVTGVFREAATLTLTAANPGKPDPEVLETPTGTVVKLAPTVLCIGLGLLKDGRHVAFEAEIEGRAVREWRPLCARIQVDGPERAWWQVGYAKLCAKRELLEPEKEANARDSLGVLAEHFDAGAAVAIIGAGRNLTALAIQVEGSTVAEPKVVARGPREFCWAELASWASLNMLPKRRKP